MYDALGRKKSGAFERALSPILDGKDEKPTLRMGRNLTEKSSLISEQAGSSDDWRSELPHLKIVAVSDAVGETVNLDREVFCKSLGTVV